jgi:hypothetical protein
MSPYQTALSQRKKRGRNEGKDDPPVINTNKKQVFFERRSEICSVGPPSNLIRKSGTQTFD